MRYSVACDWPALSLSLPADYALLERQAALGLVYVAMLAELKGVTRSWRALAQRVLCSRLCRRDGTASTHTFG